MPSEDRRGRAEQAAEAGNFAEAQVTGSGHAAPDSESATALFFEELTLNMWPALQTYHYDGWVVRFASGLSRRSNSAVPLGRGLLTLSEKIDHCVDLYEQARIEPAFKILPSADGPELEELLRGRGYARGYETRLLVRELDGPTPGAGKASVASQGPAAGEAAGAGSAVRGGTCCKLTVAEWCDNHVRLSGKGDRETLCSMMSAIPAPHTFLALVENGLPMAVGAAVLQRGWLGLQGIVVDAQQRGRGLGAAITRALLRWGREHGAHAAFLQAESSNEAALRLYAGFGFREKYRYWYRHDAGNHA